MMPEIYGTALATVIQNIVSGGGSGLPIVISTGGSDMNAFINAAHGPENVGKIFLYTGTTDNTYVQNRLYRVETDGTDYWFKDLSPVYSTGSFEPITDTNGNSDGMYVINHNLGVVPFMFICLSDGAGYAYEGDPSTYTRPQDHTHHQENYGLIICNNPNISIHPSSYRQLRTSLNRSRTVSEENEFGYQIISQTDSVNGITATKNTRCDENNAYWGKFGNFHFWLQGSKYTWYAMGVAPEAI